jgi:hypothetical protein
MRGDPSTSTPGKPQDASLTSARSAVVLSHGLPEPCQREQQVLPRASRGVGTAIEKVFGEGDEVEDLGHGLSDRLRLEPGHALRHYCASLLIRHGESVKTVQARLGHARAVETLDTYPHLWPNSDDWTREAIDSVLGPSTEREGVAQ